MRLEERNSAAASLTVTMVSSSRHRDAHGALTNKGKNPAAVAPEAKVPPPATGCCCARLDRHHDDEEHRRWPSSDGLASAGSQRGRRWWGFGLQPRTPVGER